MKNIKLVIFDWDGTLLNSIQSIVDSIQFTAKKFGYQVNEQQAKDVIGLALPLALNTVMPSEHAEQREAILQSYIAHNVPHSEQDQWFDGAEQLLIDLKNAGFLLAIATGKARKGLNRVLEKNQAQHFFDTTRCADETASKPNPLMLQQILAELNIPVDQAIMVGDSRHDLEMAQNLAMKSIGITHGVHHQSVLQQYQPVAIVNNITELSEILLKDIKVL